MDDVKYISFCPYNAGISNVILSYELFFSIAYITKRKVILPPRLYISSITESFNEKSYDDIWVVLDKNKLSEYFDIIDFYDVPEFQGKYDSMKGILPAYVPQISYTFNIESCINSVKDIKFHHDNFCFINSSDGCIADHDCVIVNRLKYSDDFKEFRSKSNRPIVDVNCNEKFLHFEGNLFGHYWYHVYPGDEEKRNELKKVINKITKYDERLYKISSIVKSKLKNYNAIHVRRGDFIPDHYDEVQSISNSKLILEKIKLLFDDKLPIYIATDEPNLNFFNDIRNEYDIYFYKDFDLKLNKIEEAVVEQIICSKSEKFYGVKRSTYTKRINTMRACEGKQYNDHIFLNDCDGDYSKKLNLYKPFPWKYETEDNYRWMWDSSSYPYWKIEKNGILKNYKFYED